MPFGLESEFCEVRGYLRFSNGQLQQHRMARNLSELKHSKLKLVNFNPTPEPSTFDPRMSEA
eukprot:7397190-Alexandrium_andersonii.AAC.1